MSKSGVALTGDWNRLRNFLSSGQEYVDLVNDTIKEEAEKLAQEVRGEIPYGTPNAPSTVQRKGFNAPLFESGTLASDSGIVVTSYGSAQRGFKKYYVIQGNPHLAVTSPDGREHLIGGKQLNYDKLLEILEEGTSEIPPRPVLTMTFDRFKGGLEREIIAKAFSKFKVALREE